MEGQITHTVELPAEKLVQLGKQKRNMRINNEHYFRAHPELRAMIAGFTSALLKEKPDDVDLFAENFFTQPDLARQLGFIGWTRPPTPEPEPEPEEEEEYDEYDEEEEVAGTTDMDIGDLEQLLISLFKEADQDESGALDHDEFVQLMQTAEVGLGRRTTCE